MKITAHRGVHENLPENTLPAFERAVELGADAVEMDIRLTADGMPVVYHYYYLQTLTTTSGAIFDMTLEQIRKVRFAQHAGAGISIPTLREVLEVLGGRIGLEIEIKGPEPESARSIGELLREYKPLWDDMEVTSFEPALLLIIRDLCPGLAVDLLTPQSQAWMEPDVVAYQSLHHARLARARAVHLHTTQIREDVVGFIRRGGIDVHVWDVNDEAACRKAVTLDIPNICTDFFLETARHVREAAGNTPSGNHGSSGA
jgi:glycerophosphoryl diester phosphodiesterase